MGVLPLQLADGATLDSLGLDPDRAGTATFAVRGIAGADPASLMGARLDVEVSAGSGGGGSGARDGDSTTIPVVARIDTPTEAAYYEHGGILQYVLRHHLPTGT
jgi:aconitate hydratase